jgi:hypothetical protein
MHQSTVLRVDQGQASLLALFLQDGDLYGAIHGPFTPDAGPGKVDWVSLKPNWKLSKKQLHEFYEDPYYCVGKRFNSRTRYLLLDIDRGSGYHPSNSNSLWTTLLGTLEDIGLVRPLVVQSSESGGLHVYFPLAEQVKTWNSAKRLQDHLERNGFTIQDGQLELFPNAKERDSAYQAHRLPLQAGSYLLNDDLQPSSTHFVKAWAIAAAGNSLETMAEIASPRHEVITSDPNRPSIQWTHQGQSNEIMRQVANWGYEKQGLTTIPALSEWIRCIAPRLPGYGNFTSPGTRNRIERGTWPKEWAASRIRRGGGIAPTKEHVNAVRADEATHRIKSALQVLGKTLWPSSLALFEAVASFIKTQLWRLPQQGHLAEAQSLMGSAFTGNNHSPGRKKYPRTSQAVQFFPAEKTAQASDLEERRKATNP